MTIEERLAKLEKGLAYNKRCNKLLICAVFLLFIGIAYLSVFETAIFTGALSARSISVSNISFVDLNDDPKGSIWAYPEGVGLYFLTPESSIMLASDSESAFLCIKYGQMSTIHFSSGPTGTSASFRLIDDEINESAMLNVNQLGHGLTLFSKNGSASLGIRNIYGQQIPSLRLTDGQSVDRATIDVSLLGPSIKLFDPNKQLRLAVGTQTTSLPDGRIIRHPESSIILYKSNGQVSWTATK